MTDNIDSDSVHQKQGNQPLLPFSGGDLDRSGIRLTRAEFARFMEVSKQSVSDWVKSGKVVLGSDGRLDPRQAVSQLLRSTDPARLRSKILAPLLKDVGTYQQRIADLERQLAAALEQAEFDSESASESLDIITRLEARLQLEWPVLREIDTNIALDAIWHWIEEAQKHGADPGVEILSFVSLPDSTEPALPGAPEKTEGEHEFGDNADDILLDGLVHQAAACLDELESMPVERFAADGGGRGE
jgi:hypothetical protein